jgi:TolB protein
LRWHGGRWHYAGLSSHAPPEGFLPQFKQYGRTLAPGTKSQLCIFDLDRAAAAVVYEADTVLEAPNWTPDGRSLLFNCGGELWLIPVAGGEPARIDTGDLAHFNNDHLLSADGRTLYASHDDGHIYALPLEGGAARQLTAEHRNLHLCYLHGVSPDGTLLSYVAVEKVGGRLRTNLFLLPAEGGPERRLTDSDLAHDGPEFSPDGAWIYFNAERASPGHAQCFRMRVDGSGVEQLTHDERVNWFPHPSPDGREVLYLSYPRGTQLHPEDVPVVLRLMAPDGSKRRDVIHVAGGQGTINVNSWAPDSRRFAFVAFPPQEAAGPALQKA